MREENYGDDCVEGGAAPNDEKNYFHAPHSSRRDGAVHEWGVRLATCGGHFYNAAMMSPAAFSTAIAEVLGDLGEGFYIEGETRPWVVLSGKPYEFTTPEAAIEKARELAALPD